tara:strand:- start:18157 stop:18843 length:687 start_codon:yes stop_codon:yes gene_type:complete
MSHAQVFGSELPTPADAFRQIERVLDQWLPVGIPEEKKSESVFAEDEAELVVAFKSGDESALEAMIRQHKVPLHRFIYRQIRDESEAADLLSQTFIKAYRNRARYQPKAKLRTWLFTIAANLCRDHGRKRKRRPGDFAVETSEDSMDVIANTEGEAPTPAEAAARNEETALLHQAIEKLPNDLKTALVLSNLEGYSHAEVAEMLGCSLKTVEMRVYHAKQKLRLLLTN